MGATVSGPASGGSGSDRRWLLLSVAAPPPGEAFLLVDALRRLGARSVEREGARVVALFSPHAHAEELAAEVGVAVRASTSLTDPAVTWRRLDRDAWAARLGPPPAPVRVGDLVIRLDPSTAFGTAEHPTTRSSLRLLEGLVARGDRVLDVGAGSAILSIAAVLLGARRADALEADPLACEAARRNVRLNDLAGRVRVRQTHVVPGVARPTVPLRRRHRQSRGRDPPPAHRRPGRRRVGRRLGRTVGSAPVGAGRYRRNGGIGRAAPGGRRGG